MVPSSTSMEALARPATEARMPKIFIIDVEEKKTEEAPPKVEEKEAESDDEDTTCSFPRDCVEHRPSRAHSRKKITPLMKARSVVIFGASMTGVATFGNRH